MALLTKADAARQLGISRTTLYKLITAGTLSPTAEGLIDTAELGRVMSTLTVHPDRLDVHPERPRTPQPQWVDGNQLCDLGHYTQITLFYRCLAVMG